MTLITEILTFFIKVFQFLAGILANIISLINPPIEVKNLPKLNKPKLCITENYKVDRIEISNITNHFCCNPSLIIFNNELITIIRGVNYNIRSGYLYYGSDTSKTIDTQNYIAKLSTKLILENIEIIEDRFARINQELIDGIEDIRAFILNEKLYGIGSGYNTKLNTNTMVLFEIKNNKLINPQIIESPFKSDREKNWEPIVINGELLIIYKFYPKIIIYKLKNGSLELFSESESDERLNYCSGGSAPIPYKNGYITVLHRRGFVDDYRFYEHLLVQMNENLEIVNISKPFYFEEFGVEFCIGLVYFESCFYFSYGVMDNKAVFIKMNENNFENIFNQ